MSQKIEFSVLIPAYNEEDTIGKLLINLQHTLSCTNADYEIIVIDDGSADNTYSIAQSMPGITVIKHPYNKGNGASVKAGIQRAKGEKLVVIDADGQHAPGYILDMLNILDEYDLVVGARVTFGIGKRGFGNFFVSKLATYLSGIEIPDLTSGFRAFKKDKLLEFIDLLPNGFSLPSTSTLAFAVNGYNIKFIPIQVEKRQGGKSSIKILRDGAKFILLIIRMITLFHPLKVFAPVSVIIFFMGLIWSFRVILVDSSISSIGAVLLLAGVITSLIGLLADQVAETRFSIGKILKFQLQKKNDDKE